MECRGRTFTPLRSSPLTQTIDWQTIRVQEICGDDRREAGRIPRTIECELTADLVDSCVPGDMVTVTAVVKATGSEEGESVCITIVRREMGWGGGGLLCETEACL